MLELLSTPINFLLLGMIVLVIVFGTIGLMGKKK